MSVPKELIIKRIFHRDQNCIALFFEKDSKIMSIVRRITGIKFSATHRCWYVPENESVIGLIDSTLGGDISVDWSAIDRQYSQVARPEAQRQVPTAGMAHGELLNQMEEKLRLKGYSGATINTYVSQFKLFLSHIDQDIKTVTEKEIRGYLLYMINKRKLSKSTQNQAINSIKFYFEKMLGQPRTIYYLDRPMKEHKLPSVLSEKEISLIFDAVGNSKHKLMLMIIYSAGLRRSELLNLHRGDIDRERNSVFIRGGKGSKDRTSILAKRLRALIGEYLDEYRPSYWLFEGVNRRKYSATSLHQVFVRAVRKAGISKEVSLHTLRHSFATHLLESGASTLYIQKLLGHESPKTTEIYAQVTKFGLDRIRSPLDQEAFDKTEGE